MRNYIIKYFINYLCGSDLLARWLSLFLYASISIRERIFVNARIRAGSKFKLFLRFVFIDVRCFRLPPKMSSRTPGWRPPIHTNPDSVRCLPGGHTAVAESLAIAPVTLLVFKLSALRQTAVWRIGNLWISEQHSVDGSLGCIKENNWN
jgi:hypothetical protein